MYGVATVAEKDTEYCVYVTMKIDRDVLPFIKGAAGVERKTVQEYASDVLNEAAAKKLGQKPVKRKPPEPKKTKRKKHDRT